MKQSLKLLTLGLIACFTVGTAVAADTSTEQLPSAQQVTDKAQSELPDKVASPLNTFSVKNGFDSRDIHKTDNMACGFPPFPPFGCKAVCVCDQNGQNCHWTFICS